MSSAFALFRRQRPLAERNNPICPICSTPTFEVWSEGDLYAAQCPLCSVIYSPRTVQHDIFDETYFQKNYLAFSEARVQHFRRLVALTGISIHTPLLDVGAGVGLFLQSLSHHVRDRSVAVEPASFAREWMVAEKVVPCTVESIDAIPVGFGPFATVTLWDVIPSIENPVDLLQSIQDRLTRDSTLIIKTPYKPLSLFKIASLLAPIGKGHSLLHVPAQVFHFTPAALERLLNSTGFSVRSWQWVPEAPLLEKRDIAKTSQALVARFIYFIVARHRSFVCIAKLKDANQ